MSAVRKIVLRAATDTQSSRALRAAVRDCTYIKASSIIALRQSRGLRLNTKAGQALMRHINRTRLHMLYSRAQVGGRAAWMGLRRRVFEAQSHPLVVARKQRLVALRQRYFLRRRNDSNTAAAARRPRRGAAAARGSAPSREGPPAPQALAHVERIFFR